MHRPTTREIEVLARIARGRSYAEVARDLDISAHTVTNHMRQLLLKLDASSQAHAVYLAMRAGWLE